MTPQIAARAHGARLAKLAFGLSDLRRFSPGAAALRHALPHAAAGSLLGAGFGASLDPDPETRTRSALKGALGGGALGLLGGTGHHIWTKQVPEPFHLRAQAAGRMRDVARERAALEGTLQDQYGLDPLHAVMTSHGQQSAEGLRSSMTPEQHEGLRRTISGHMQQLNAAQAAQGRARQIETQPENVWQGERLRNLWQRVHGLPE
jgi:hypothetical protein